MLCGLLIFGVLTQSPPLSLPGETAQEPRPVEQQAPGADRKPDGELPTRPPALPDPLLPGRGRAGLDVEHYALRLRLDPERRFVEGQATLRFTLAAEQEVLELDFHHMLDAQQVVVGERIARAAQGDHVLRIALEPPLTAGPTHAVTIQYRGLLPQEESQGEPVGLIHDGVSLVAYQQPDGAHHWFPCNDHPSDKATFWLRIEAADEYAIAALGERTDVGESTRPGMRWETWETRIPTATYLVALGVGPWTAIDRAGTRVPLRDWCEERDREAIEVGLAGVADMLPYFEERFGPYPFEKYGHVVTRAWIGGMENQTLAVLGRESALAGDQALLAHELAHQWFGNWVSPEQWDDLWLNEGWASWAEALWFDQAAPPRAEALRALWRDSTIKLAIRAHPHTLARPDAANLFDGLLVYDKGAMVIELLDGYLGRSALLGGARAWLERYGAANASTADFRATLEEHTGEDLAPFFAAWVETNDLPEIAWDWKAVPAEDGWDVEIRLEQRNGHFPMATVLDLQGGADGPTLRLPVRFDAPALVLRATTDFEPERLVLDPDRRAPWVPAEPSEDR